MIFLCIYYSLEFSGLCLPASSYFLHCCILNVCYKLLSDLYVLASFTLIIEGHCASSGCVLSLWYTWNGFRKFTVISVSDKSLFLSFFQPLSEMLCFSHSGLCYEPVRRYLCCGLILSAGTGRISWKSLFFYYIFFVRMLCYKQFLHKNI